MISRNRIGSQIFIDFISCEFIPGSSAIHIGPVAIPGVDDASNSNISFFSICIRGIKGQCTPIKTDSHFTVEGNLPATGFDQPVILCTIRCTTAVHMSKIGTDRMTRRICLARKCSFPIPFGIGRITGVFHRTAGSGCETSSVGIDIRINDYGPDLVPVAVRIQDHIQLARRRSDVAVDGDIPHSVQGKGRIVSCRLIDVIFDDDIGRSVSGYCLDGHIRASIQHFFHHISRNPGHGAVDGRRIGCGGIGVVVADGGTAIGEIRIRGGFLFRVFIIACRCRIVISNDYVQRIQQPFPGLAGYPFCVDIQTISQIQHVTRCFNRTAVDIAPCQKLRSIMDDGLLADCLDRTGILPFFRTGSVKCTADFDLSIVPTVEKDLAFFIFTQRLSFDSTAVVDDRAQDIASTFSRHDDVSAIGFERTTVERLCPCHRTIDSENQFPISITGQIQILCCRKSYRTAVISNGTAVFYV